MLSVVMVIELSLAQKSEVLLLPIDISLAHKYCSCSWSCPIPIYDFREVCRGDLPHRCRPSCYIWFSSLFLILLAVVCHFLPLFAILCRCLPRLPCLPYSLSISVLISTATISLFQMNFNFPILNYSPPQSCPVCSCTGCGSIIQSLVLRNFIV